MEKIKRKINFEVYIIALLITIMFFVSGILVGKYFAYEKADNLEVSQKAISAFLTLSEIKGENIDKEITNYCNLSWEDVWLEKVEIGSILSGLESKLGKDNPKILEQKMIYNEVQFKTLELVEKINNNCNKNWSIILFFYTNNKNTENDAFKLSELQGAILDTVYETNKDKVKIFSFDVNLGDNSTKSLIENYKITSTPALVIKDSAYNRFMNKNEITQIIKE